MKQISILALLLSVCILSAQTAPFSVKGSSAQRVQLELKTPQLKIEELEFEGRMLPSISMDKAFNPDPGEAGLPLFSTMVAIPPQGNYTLSWSHGGVEYIDAPEFFTLDGEERDDALQQPSSLVLASEPAILRDFRVVQLSVNPCQYDPLAHKFAVYQDIQISLEFSPEQGINELPDYAGYSPVFEKLYEAQIANFDDYRHLRSSNLQARILLIHGNSSDQVFLTKLNEFVAWKRQKGFLVNVASTVQAGSSNSAIKNYIQTQYNNPETRPDYIILLGDTGGSYAIPAWNESYSGYSGIGDYPYTHLAGSDLLGDVFIGRISAENLSQLITLFQKIYIYEKNVNNNPPAAAWLNRILLVGDIAHGSGISTIYNCKYVREISQKANPDYEYIENYSSGFSNTMNTGINQGVAFFNYRGWLGMSGWSPSNALSNGPRMPHSVTLTCSTGDYGSTSTTENFIRLGTEAEPKGAITAIGMATTGTHTMLNNALATGIFNGIFQHGMRDMGQALLNGRIHLSNLYGQSNSSQSNSSAHWCNLMGDPTVEAFVGIPGSLVIEAPTNIPSQTPLVDILVTDPDQNPLENICVTLYSPGYADVVATGFTNSSGMVVLNVPNFVTSNLVVTASAQNYKPAQKTIDIDSTGSLVFSSKTTLDNGTQGSSGNSDGFINAGETIALFVELYNSSAESIQGISAQLGTNDPMLTLIQAQSSYDDFLPSVAGINQTPFLIQFGNNISAFHDSRFSLDLTDSEGNVRNVIFHLGAFNANLNVANYTVSAGGDNVLDPGETGSLNITVNNSSVFGAFELYGELTTLNDLLVVNQPISWIGSISAGTSSSFTEGFEIFARPLLIPGMTIPLKLRLYNDQGFEQICHFSITIGKVSQNTPLGPDEYGYLIYDVSDTAFPDCPTYEWIEIVPNLGGGGSLIPGFNDAGSSSSEGDTDNSTVLKTVELPFNFRFYGEDYERITVCSNGFIAMGITEDGDFRNTSMPGVGGPSPMIAPFWDDLIIPSGAGIYQYHDVENHLFIIQWHNLKNGYNRTSEETFQVIFYDPMFYPTGLDDGMIKIQYKAFNNVDIGGSGYSPRHGQYATVGIRDHTGTRGLQYTYNNQYPPAAQPLGNQKALLITTTPVLFQHPHLVVDEIIIDDENGNSWLEPGESALLGIKLNNLGLDEASSVQINISTSSPHLSIENPQSDYPNIPGSGSGVNYTPIRVLVSSNCPGDASISLELSVSAANNSWVYPYSIIVKKPVIQMSGIFINDSTGNGNGMADPDETFTLVVNYSNHGNVEALNLTSNITCLSEHVSIVNPQQLIPFIPAGNTAQAAYTVSLSPNVIVGNNLTFYLTYLGDGVTAQNESILLNVGTTGMYEDFELNDGGFTAQPSNNGWQWGADNTVGAHSGTKVWGTQINQQYSSNANWTLTSPPVFIGDNFVLEFYHWYQTESNYDGGNVKASTNEGQTWTTLTPEGGYPTSNISALSGPGYSGSSGGWTLARFPLSQYNNQNVRFRWSFASDYSTNSEGWFIDDVQTTGFIPFAGKASGTIETSKPEEDFSQTAVFNDGDIICYPDSEGYYEFFLPTGEHKITATGPGYLEQSVQPIALNLQNPSAELDFFLHWFQPVEDLQFSVEEDLLTLNWQPPQDGVVSYKIIRKLNSGKYEQIAQTQEAQYLETLFVEGDYRYQVVACYENGESVESEPVSFAYPYVSQDDPQTPPLVSRLHQNYPNPFNSSTTIAFDLALPANVELCIYNVKGQLVRELSRGSLPAGNHNVVWDGRDLNGKAAASGIYFIRLQSPVLNSTRKAVLLK